MSAAELVGEWLAEGRLNLPLPAGGHTPERWQALAAFCEADVAAGRLAEAHADAVAILAELDGPAVANAQWWAVWAAEAGPMLSAVSDGGQTVLNGDKPWCSGATLCTHALVTARSADGGRGLYAVALDQPSVTPLAATWRHSGMSATDTRSVRFAGAAALAIGHPGQYLARAGFWHGAIGVAACWLGAARAVAQPLYRRVADQFDGPAADPHTRAHLGAVDAALAGAAAVLDAAGASIDDDARTGADALVAAEVRARRVRAVVESTVETVAHHTARALGPGPLVMDPVHAQRTADLAVYVRQSHAERDLARLGELVAGGG